MSVPARLSAARPLQPDPTPSITPDETFARKLHAWLDSRPPHNRALQDAASAWLVAKNL